MAFNTSALSTWVQTGDLFAKSLYSPLSAKYFSVEDGIKGYRDMFPFATTTAFQAGACSYNATNSTVVSAVRLTVDIVSTMETFCVSDFNNYAIGAMLKPGTSDNDDETFVNMFAGEKLQSATNGLWEMAWKGNKATGTGNLALTDGILQKLIHTSASASTVSATSAITASNIVDAVDYMINSAPVALLQHKDVILYMTSANYRLYVQALKTANNFHFTGEFSNFETTVPGYPMIKVAGIPEIDGNADGIDMILTYVGNFVYGCDTQQESTSYDLWYSKDDRNIKSALETKIGTAVREPAQVVIIK